MAVLHNRKRKIIQHLFFSHLCNAKIRALDKMKYIVKTLFQCFFSLPDLLLFFGQNRYSQIFYNRAVYLMYKLIIFLRRLQRGNTRFQLQQMRHRLQRFPHSHSGGSLRRRQKIQPTMIKILKIIKAHFVIGLHDLIP